MHEFLKNANILKISMVIEAHYEQLYSHDHFNDPNGNSEREYSCDTLNNELNTYFEEFVIFVISNCDLN
jgi:hypothetical protein